MSHPIAPASPLRLLAALLVLALGGVDTARSGPSGLEEPTRNEVERKLLDLEDQWIQVYTSHDLSVLHRLLAEDFVATLADGAMRGKREHIAAYPADFEAFSSVTNSDLKVRVFARDVAVVTGLYTATLRGKQGPAAVSRYRYTDTWLHRAGSWQCVATHESSTD